MQIVRKRLQDIQIVPKAVTHHSRSNRQVKISDRKSSKKIPNLVGMIKTYVPKETRHATKPEIATHCALFGYAYLTLLGIQKQGSNSTKPIFTYLSAKEPLDNLY